MEPFKITDFKIIKSFKDGKFKGSMQEWSYKKDGKPRHVKVTWCEDDDFDKFEKTLNEWNSFWDPIMVALGHGNYLFKDKK